MIKKYSNKISLILIVAIIIGFLFTPSVKAEEKPAKNFTLKKPYTDAEGVSTWDCIYFGNYWQNDTNGDGIADQNDEKEPIKWRILSIDGDDAFLLADQCLNSLAYNKLLDDNITWEHCTLRSWLNGYSSECNTVGVDYSGCNFIEAAFSPEEQKMIYQTKLNNKDNPELETKGGNDTLDKIYLLSVQDIVNDAYGFLPDNNINRTSNTRVTTNTAYVESDYYDFFYSYPHSEPKIWMLRTQGYFDPLCVGTSGAIDDRGYDMQEWFGVRPALHMNISETGLWSYAGQVSADGANPVVPTSTPSVVPSCMPTVPPTAEPSILPSSSVKPSILPAVSSAPPTAKPSILPTSSTKPSVFPSAPGVHSTAKPLVLPPVINATADPSDHYSDMGDLANHEEGTVEVGKTVVIKKLKYKITKLNKTGAGEVTLMGAAEKKAGQKLKSIKIRNTVTIHKMSFKVTSIDKNAFSGCRSLKSLVLGKNITTIGNRAFYGCRHLKSIEIKSKKLKAGSIGKKAFWGITKNAKIKVPKKKKKVYQKWLKKKGITKKMRIK